MEGRDTWAGFFLTLAERTQGFVFSHFWHSFGVLMTIASPPPDLRYWLSWNPKDTARVGVRSTLDYSRTLP
jgi:hypothetical protein